MLMVGKSGRGKTTYLLRLIMENIVDTNRLFFFTPSIHQVEYQIFIKALQAGLTFSHIKDIFLLQNEIHDYEYWIKEVSKRLKKSEKNNIEVYFSDKIEDIPTPKSMFKKGKKTLIIIDDAIMSNQTSIGKLFVYGRTYGMNVIYLTQAFMAVKKSTCREQANVFIFFKIIKDMENIYKHIAKEDFDKLIDFENYAKECWTTYINGEKRRDDDPGVMIVREKMNESIYFNGDLLFLP